MIIILTIIIRATEAVLTCFYAWLLCDPEFSFVTKNIILWLYLVNVEVINTNLKWIKDTLKELEDEDE